MKIKIITAKLYHAMKDIWLIRETLKKMSQKIGKSSKGVGDQRRKSKSPKFKIWTFR